MQPLSTTTGSEDSIMRMGEEIKKQWDPFVILISYSVSALGSYTTLQIISQTRTKASSSPSSSSSMFTVQMWLLFASLVFGGCAVWSMHFLGMMALNLGLEVAYEPILTVISLVVPVAASHIAFQFMRFYVKDHPPHFCAHKLTSNTSNNSIRNSIRNSNNNVINTQNINVNLNVNVGGSEYHELDDLHHSDHHEHVDVGLNQSGQITHECDYECDHSDAPRTLEDGYNSEDDSMDDEEYDSRQHNNYSRLRRSIRRSTNNVVYNLRLIPCWRIVLGGVFLALGIFAMHFIGMLAMRMNATVTWHWGYVITSFVIAWMAASSSLYIVSFCYLLWQQFMAALLMSLAVTGMHFVGMASATYTYTDGSVPSGSLVLSGNFASIISIMSTVTSFIFFGLASGNTSRARDRLEREIELRKTMEKLMLEKEAAELADRTKSAFVATVSHEIRTPMNIIIGATELLTSTKQSEEQVELTNTIQASSRGLLGMINDILDFSKLNNNRMQLERLGFSPMEVIEDIVSMSVVSASENLDLLLRVNEDANLRVVGDPVRFQQIILNLVSNAIKFTEKGFIFVDMYCTEKTACSCQIVVAIEDSGIGISQESCDKIFEPFVQADSSYARRFGGTGLGLSVCKQLVELMGGTIQVKSNMGKGTTFTIALPFSLDVIQTKFPNRLNFHNGLNCYLGCRTEKSLGILRSFLEKWGINVYTDKARGNFDIYVIDVELLPTVNLTNNDKPVIITNPRKQRPDKLPSRSVFLRRPVFEERLFLAISQALRTSTSPFTSPVSPHRSPKDTSREELHEAKILLVEDNKLVQQIAIRLLGKLGLDVEVAENGLEAVNMISTMSYYAVLMDCQMPVMDGFEATRQIRKLEQEKQMPRTKIIALTAGVSEELRKECLTAGMDTYITKPVTLHTLQHALGLNTKRKQLDRWK